MIKPKTIIIGMTALFFVFAAYYFFKTLEPPSHIHERDDVPAGETAAPGDLIKRIRSLEAQLEKEPENYEILMALGHALLENRQFPKAAKIFQRAASANPESAEASVDLGIALKESGQIEEARQQFEQTVKNFPDYPEGWLQLAVIYRRQLGDNEKALLGFRKFLELDSKSPLAPRIKEEIASIEKELNPHQQ